MKKTIRIVVAFSMLFASSSLMAQSFGMAGCGLGSMIIKSPGKAQIFAATTNGSFASQGFGVISGTSNCNPNGISKMLGLQSDFVKHNFVVLSKEIAQGHGDSLAALSSTP